MMFAFKSEFIFYEFSEELSTINAELPSTNGEENPTKKLRAGERSK